MLSPQDLLLKEHDIALDLVRDARQAQYKTAGICSVLVVGLAAFIVKGDIPKEGYLLLAAAVLLSILYVGLMSAKKVCAHKAYTVSERRLRESVRAERPDTIVFDLVHRTKFIRDGYKTEWFRVFQRLFLYLLVVTGYAFFVQEGSTSLSISDLARWGIRILFYVSLLLVALVGWLENRGGKARHKLIMEHPGLRPPDSSAGR